MVEEDTDAEEVASTVIIRDANGNIVLLGKQVQQEPVPDADTGS